MLKKVRTMLGINIRYIFQDSIKVAECLFLEIFREEKIWMPSFLILLDKGKERYKRIISVDRLKGVNKLSELFVVRVFNGEEQNKF